MYCLILFRRVQKFSRDLGNSADALKQWAAGEGEDLSVSLLDLYTPQSSISNDVCFVLTVEFVAALPEWTSRTWPVDLCCSALTLYRL
jgi:hypothetical protein